MAINCSAPSFMDGGTINSATVTNSTVQGSVINGSHIEASALHKVTEVDEATAQVLANAIAKLGTEELRALAKAIADAMPVIEPALGPAHSKEDSLPLEIAGDRRYLLGAPNGWLTLRGVVVPAYKAQS